MALITSENVRDVPILFIFFNRADHAQRVFEVLKQIRPRQVFLAGDGPRADRPGEAAHCRETRDIARQIDWPCEVHTRFLDQNLGCKLAVSSAISWFFEHVEQGIILEDDCVPSLSFFSFCGELLEKYRDDQRVMQISGSNFLEGRGDDSASYYFSALNDIWGWATWRRAWRHFDLAMPDYHEFRQRKLLKTVVGDPAIAKWLESYLDEANRPDCKVWSSQWSYAMARQGGLTIVPSVNLVRNIGFDDTGSSGSSAPWKYYDKFSAENIGALVHPHFMLPDRGADRLRFEVIRKTDPRLFASNRLRAAARAAIPADARRVLKRLLSRS